MRAIVDLESEIQKSAIPTSRITDQVNANVTEIFKVDARSIGKVCKKIGLNQKRSGSARLWSITPEKLDNFKLALNNVTNVTHVANPYLSCVLGDDKKKHDVTNVIDDEPADHDISDVTKINVADVNPYKSNPYDISDVYDHCCPI
jgi:hypothetical protein